MEGEASALQQQQQQEEGQVRGQGSTTAGSQLQTAPGGGARAKAQVVIVTGPTAVGKTAISLLLAQRLRAAPCDNSQGDIAAAAAAGTGGCGGSGGHADAAAGGGGSAAGGAAAAQCELGGEVISADSVQVYRSLDVGSDKLPVEQRRGVPHHLIDVREPLQDYSAGDFFEEARAAAQDIVQRGRVPLVVGGTGLYLRWFVVGKGGAPKATPEALAAVNAAMQAAWDAAAAAKLAAAAGAAGGGQGAAGGAAAVAAASGRVDAPGGAGGGGSGGSAGVLSEDERWDVAAALLREWGDDAAYARIGVERNNYYRLERALVILHMHPGSRLSDFDPQQLDVGDPATWQQLDYDFRCFFLHRPRPQLYDRIALRVEEMVVGGGLLEEAAMLLRLGLAPGQNMAGKAIGYRQAMEWLLLRAASGRPAGVGELVALHAAITQATHKLVRAQMTWFRDDPMYRWVDVAGREAGDVVDEILACLQQPQHQGGCADNSGRLSKAEHKAVMSHKAPLQLLTEEAAAGAAAVAAAQEGGGGQAGVGGGGGGGGGGAGKPRFKSKAAEAAAMGALRRAEEALRPLLIRVNEGLLPGLPEHLVRAAAAEAAAAEAQAAAAAAAREEERLRRRSVKREGRGRGGGEGAGASGAGSGAASGDEGTGMGGREGGGPEGPEAKRARSDGEQ